MSDERTVEQVDAEMARLAEERIELVKKERKSDLETVKALCKKHNFSPTDLRGCLKTRKKRQTKAKQQDAAKEDGQ